MGKSKHVNRTMDNNGIVDPTAREAIRNLKNAAVDIANGKNVQKTILEIDRKHHEYTLISIDKYGHKTYVGRTYETEDEIPVII